MSDTCQQPVSKMQPGNALIRLLHRIRIHIGIDRAIAFTVLARTWSSTAGLVTVVLIAHFLTPAEQGYYYTFGSLVALQIVFELGFSFVILQLASHERAHLSISDSGIIEGPKEAHARLSSVLQKAVRWYSSAAGFLCLFLLFAGLYFFGAHQQSGQLVLWRPAWYFTAVVASITFQLDPVLSFMEGCGFVSNVARVRAIQAVVGSCMAWIALATGHGLFAPGMVMLGNAAVALAWLAKYRVLLIGLLRYKPQEHNIHWMKEVWPFQWRIAVSWLCGYFLFQIFNPLLFAFRGAAAAGQMGMSLSLANALQAVAVSWVSTKAAPFGSLIAKKQFERLDLLFFKSIRQALIVCISCGTFAWAGVVCLNLEHLKFAERLLSPSLIAILFLSTTINIVIFGEAYYLRAHKEEKFLPNSVIGAIATALSSYYFGRLYGAAGMIIGYCVLNSLGLVAATLMFLRFRRIWHAAQ